MLAQLFDDHVAVFETNAVLASDRATHLDGQPLDPSDELARLLFLLWRKEDCSVEITLEEHQYDSSLRTYKCHSYRRQHDPSMSL